MREKFLANMLLLEIQLMKRGYSDQEIEDLLVDVLRPQEYEDMIEFNIQNPEATRAEIKEAKEKAIRRRER